MLIFLASLKYMCIIHFYYYTVNFVITKCYTDILMTFHALKILIVLVRDLHDITTANPFILSLLLSLYAAPTYFRVLMLSV